MRSAKAITGLAILGIFAVMALIGPWIFADASLPVGRPLQEPTWSHWLGTTGQGQDVLALTVAGTKIGGSDNNAASDGGSTAPAGGGSPAKSAGPAGGKLGSPGNPLKVSLVSFHGYAPALVANGNSLRTQPGSIYAKLGLNVEFVINDDIPTLTTLFEAKTAQCAWRTSDFWAQEQPNLRNSGHDGKGDHHIYLINPDGSERVQLTSTLPGSNFAYFTQPTFSHDGKLLACTMYRPAGPQESSEIVIFELKS